MLIGVGSVAFAAAGHAEYAKRFPFVRDIPIRDWNLVVAIAGSVVAALHDRTARESQEERHRILADVTRELVDFDSRASTAIDDCFAFLGKSLSTMTDAEKYLGDPKSLLAEGAAYWSVSQMVGHHADSEDERTLAGELGVAFRIGWPHEA